MAADEEEAKGPYCPNIGSPPPSITENKYIFERLVLRFMFCVKTVSKIRKRTRNDVFKISTRHVGMENRCFYLLLIFPFYSSGVEQTIHNACLVSIPNPTDLHKSRVNLRGQSICPPLPHIQKRRLQTKCN